MSQRNAEKMTRVHLHISIRDLERLDTIFGTVKRSEAVRKILRLYLNGIEARAMREARTISVEEIKID